MDRKCAVAAAEDEIVVAHGAVDLIVYPIGREQQMLGRVAKSGTVFWENPLARQGCRRASLALSLNPVWSLALTTFSSSGVEEMCMARDPAL